MWQCAKTGPAPERLNRYPFPFPCSFNENNFICIVSEEITVGGPEMCAGLDWGRALNDGQCRLNAIQAVTESPWSLWTGERCVYRRLNTSWRMDVGLYRQGRWQTGERRCPLWDYHVGAVVRVDAEGGIEWHRQARGWEWGTREDQWPGLYTWLDGRRNIVVITRFSVFQ